MEDKEKTIQALLQRIEQLSRQEKVFHDEIQRLRQDVDNFRRAEQAPIQTQEKTTAEIQNPVSKVAAFVSQASVPPPRMESSAQPAQGRRTPWEEFIGENLLNKIGIAVLIIGIGFGTKYSIDHQLINPLTRVILGYLSGLALIAIAFRLKNNHAGFSAVLLSGGMTVLYFITFVAYDLYALIPQVMAFALMVVFTIFTVFAAVQYSLEVIGIIGLVGAYAVPILLSDGSGRVVILFSYISVINAGILFLAFKKYWKRLYYLAFVLTWLTFSSWFTFSFDADTHIVISLLFSTIFFLTFYATFLASKLIRGEGLARWDVVLMLANAFIYFGLGYLTLQSVGDEGQYLGLFTVFTALIHFIAAAIIYKQSDRFGDVFYFAAGMVLIFLTLAVPVQLEGNWVTLIWAGEAVWLFWIGRSKAFSVYEKISYPLMALAFLSLLHDWRLAYPEFYDYPEEFAFTIFLNIHFLTSMLVAAALLFIFKVSRNSNYRSPLRTESHMHSLLTLGLPLVALLVIYFGFYNEVQKFWDYRYAASYIAISETNGAVYDHDLLNFRSLWLILYSAIFGCVLSLIQWKIRHPLLGFIAIAFNALVLICFITAGLLDLSALRSCYLNQDLALYYDRDDSHFFMRYFSLLLMVVLLWSNTRLVKTEFFTETIRKFQHLFLHFIILVLLSSELIHWLDMARVENSFKLSLSILWGVYALFLVVLGLSREQRYIRLGAMVLFAATLLKLFAYDMAGMSAILKTVVLIILGALLLTASFIYNKYKRTTGNEMP